MLFSLKRAFKLWFIGCRNFHNVSLMKRPGRWMGLGLLMLWCSHYGLVIIS